MWLNDLMCVLSVVSGFFFSSSLNDAMAVVVVVVIVVGAHLFVLPVIRFIFA